MDELNIYIFGDEKSSFNKHIKTTFSKEGRKIRK